MAPNNWPPFPGTNSQPGSTNNLCENCHQRPKFVENGRTHPYCGRTCAKEAANGGSKTSNSGHAPSDTRSDSGSSNLCENCHSRPKFVENGRTHPYCGNACAKQAAGSGKPHHPTTPAGDQDDDPSDNSDAEFRSDEDDEEDHAEVPAYMTEVVADRLCKSCHTRPRQIEEGLQQDFCSDECARKGVTNRAASAPGLTGALPVPDDADSDWDEDDMGDTDATDGVISAMTNYALATPVARYTTNKSAPVNRYGKPAKRRHCMLCRRPCYVNRRTRKVSEWCTKRHRRAAVTRGRVEACLYCKFWPKALLKNGKRADFCTRTHANIVMNAAPILLDLDHGSKDYKSIEHQFTSKWLHHTNKPRVTRIIQLFEPRWLFHKYRRYRAHIDQIRGGFPGRPFGNEQRRWHGTNRQCHLGEASQGLKFCNYANCSLCMICKTSFKLTKFGTAHAWGRFGHGIYVSSTSSKSNDYVRNQTLVPPAGSLKAMIVARVVCGRVKKYTQDQPHLTGPPHGFDCVIGEPVPGSSVNYDEEIVYTDDAIRPAYVVMYQ